MPVHETVFERTIPVLLNTQPASRCFSHTPWMNTGSVFTRFTSCSSCCCFVCRCCTAAAFLCFHPCRYDRSEVPCRAFHSDRPDCHPHRRAVSSPPHFAIPTRFVIPVPRHSRENGNPLPYHDSPCLPPGSYFLGNNALAWISVLTGRTDGVLRHYRTRKNPSWFSCLHTSHRSPRAKTRLWNGVDMAEMFAEEVEKRRFETTFPGYRPCVTNCIVGSPSSAW